MTSEDVALPRSAANNHVSARPVLGNVSPNIRSPGAPATRLFDTKPLSGSPLKRSFTTAAMGEPGLTYFKRSKLSLDVSLGEQPFGSSRGHDKPTRLNDSALQLLPGSGIDPSLPTVHQPSPTEPDTPTSTPDEEEMGSSAERRSFSSLINYDPSSQAAPVSQSNPGLLFQGPSYAELLRLRLRVAMYKVRTNQITIPFTELRVEGDADTATTATTADIREDSEHSPAAGDPHPLLSGPVLRPTAYSSRMIYDASVPSSPPVAASPEKLPGLATPKDAGRFSRPDEAELTSSIVKGRGAEALLGLRNAL